MSREIEAARLRRIDELNRSIHLAWHIEWMKTQVKKKKSGKGISVKMPKLEKFLIPDEEKPKRQTVKQMRSVLETLAERTGRPLRKATPRGK